MDSTSPTSFAHDDLWVTVKRWVHDSITEQQFKSGYPERLSYRIRFGGEYVVAGVNYGWSVTFEARPEPPDEAGPPPLKWHHIFGEVPTNQLVPMIWRIGSSAAPTPAGIRRLGNKILAMLDSDEAREALVTGWERAQDDWMFENVTRARALHDLAFRYADRRTALPPIPTNQEVGP